MNVERVCAFGPVLLLVGGFGCSSGSPSASPTPTDAVADVAEQPTQDVVASDVSGGAPETLAGCTPGPALACDRIVDLEFPLGALQTATCGGAFEGALPFHLQVDAPATVTLSLESADGAPELVALGDGCDTASCSSSTGGQLTLPVSEAGARDLFVVSGGASTGKLAVTCCTPSCAGRTCGNDGCGGSCGACESGFVCDGTAGACVNASCVPVSTLGCGDSVSGVMSDGPGSTDAVPGTSCNPYDYSGPEMAYAFESEFTGTLVARLPQFDGNEELDVFILGGGGACDPSQCLAEGLAMASAPVVAGQRYYVLVDGYQGNVSRFDLSLECCTPSCAGKNCGDDGCGGSCGECSEGEFCDPEAGLCSNPVCTPSDALSCGSVLTAVASDGPGSTDVLFTTGCSPGQNYTGHEQVFRFEPKESQSVTFSSPPFDEDEDLDLFLLRDSGGKCLMSECLTFGFNGLTTDVVGGETYYLVVDGYQGNVSKFNLEVSCCTPSCDGKACGTDGCGGTCGTCALGSICTNDGGSCAVGGYVGNDTCATAVVVEALPFEAQVDTKPAKDDYLMDGKAGCVEQYAGGPDVVFSWTATESGTLVVTVVAANDDETCSPVVPDPGCSPKVAYVTQGCPDQADGCLDAVDLYKAPNKVLSVKDVVVGTTYTVVVDGFDGTEAGVASIHMELQ